VTATPGAAALGTDRGDRMPVTSGAVLGVLADGGGIDFARLRAWRRDRLFTAMDDQAVDALMLGRGANIEYASGARQLWVAGTRPFGPACVVVRATRRVHLLSVWDDGVPPEVPHEDLYGLSWNPANLFASLHAIPGLADAARLGTDSFAPGFDQFIGALAPRAEVLDGRAVLGPARAVKSPDELECIRTATAIAEAGLEALVDHLRPGMTERQLLGAYLGRIASLGAPTPPVESVVCATPRHGPVALRHLVSDRPVGAGELVVLNPGAMYAGYEGGVGRTWVCPRAPSAAQVALATRCHEGMRAVIELCRPGRTGSDLRRAWEVTGAPLPAAPLVHGLGLGMEPPVIAPGVGDDAVVSAGMVLAVQGWVAAPGVGGFLEREVVAVGHDGAELVSAASPGPVRTA